MSEFLAKLQEELALWEKEGLLPPESVQALRRRYGFEDSPPPTDAGQRIRWVLYLAVFAFLAAFFSFAGSSDALSGGAARVAVLLLASLAAVGAGVVLHRRHRTEGMALLILGGMLLPIAFYFTVHQYGLLHTSIPYLWWFVLALCLAASYTVAAAQLQEEGLGGVAVLSAGAAAFLLARHAGLLQSFYPALTAVLALGCLRVELGLPKVFTQAFARVTWLFGQVLAGAALLLPFALQCYGSAGAVTGYLIAAGYFLLRVRLRDSMFSIAPLILALVAALGAIVRAAGVADDLLPLLQLSFSAALIGAGMVLLRQRERALAILLLTVLFILLPGAFGLSFLHPEMFRAPWLYTLSLSLYAALGAGLYAVARWQKSARDILSYLGTWHLFAALVLLLGGERSAGIEAYTLPLGGLLLIDLFFVAAPHRQWLLGVATAVLALPSLYLSIADRGPLRTVLLCLGGISLVAVGAFRGYGPALLLGVFVLLPAIFIKVLPGLAELGVPRFVWFALFGALLVAIALVLQRRTRPS